MPVPNKDGMIRVCGDFKVTINPALRVDQYPLPKPSDLMASLASGMRFTKLDLTSAYQQMMHTNQTAQENPAEAALWPPRCGTDEGSLRMKTLARSHVWWPDIDEQIEEYAKAGA